MASKYTLLEQVEEALDEWDEDIAAVERGGRVFIAFEKFVRVPIADDCAILDVYEDPAAYVTESQSIGLVMAGRRRWQDDIGEILRAVVAAEEEERERKQRELDDVRAQLRADFMDAARDRVMVGPGMSGDRMWHRTGDIGSKD